MTVYGNNQPSDPVLLLIIHIQNDLGVCGRRLAFICYHYFGYNLLSFLERFWLVFDAFKFKSDLWLSYERCNIYFLPFAPLADRLCNDIYGRPLIQGCILRGLNMQVYICAFASVKSDDILVQFSIPFIRYIAAHRQLII